MSRSDECHFNVSLTVRDKVTRQCPWTTTFEEKREPKRIRTEVPPLTSLTTARPNRLTDAEVQYIFRPRKPEGSLGRTAQRTATSTLTQLLNYDSRPLFFFHVALRPRRRDGILGTGTEYEWEGDDRR